MGFLGMLSSCFLFKITVVKVEKGSFLDAILSEGMGMWFGNYMGYVWLLITIMFLFAELNTPGLFFFVSFAAGSLCAAILAFLGYSLFVQCMSGLTVTLVVFFLMRKFLKRKQLSEVQYGSSVTNIDALVGRRGMVLEAIELHKKGLVKIGGEKWRASAEGEVGVEAGVVVSVLRVEGNTVVVEPTEKVEPSQKAEPLEQGEKE